MHKKATNNAMEVKLFHKMDNTLRASKSFQSIYRDKTNTKTSKIARVKNETTL